MTIAWILLGLLVVAGCDARDLEKAPSVVQAPSGVTMRAAASASPAMVEQRFDIGADGWLPRTAPKEVGLNEAAIDALIQRAKATQSDSLIVVKRGKLVVERYFGQPRTPIETRSITKSVVMLAVLALVADGRIASLDVPLSTWLEDFADGAKARVTLRHVLTHTSGLAHGRTDANALNRQDDRLTFVRSLPVEQPPGARFSYNNEATQLLAEVIARAAGEPVDAYVAKRLFAPLDIVPTGETRWSRDRAGGIQTYYGLRLTARELTRLGLLIADGGVAGGRRLLSEEGVKEMVAASSRNLSFGLLFWRRADLVQRHDVVGEAFGALEPLGQRVFRSEQEYFDAAASILGSARSVVRHHQLISPVLEERRAIGVHAVGGLGQRLVIYPEADLVAVRQHRRRPGDDHRPSVAWKGFCDRVEAIEPRLQR